MPKTELVAPHQVTEGSALKFDLYGQASATVQPETSSSIPYLSDPILEGSPRTGTVLSIPRYNRLYMDENSPLTKLRLSKMSLEEREIKFGTQPNKPDQQTSSSSAA